MHDLNILVSQWLSGKRPPPPIADLIGFHLLSASAGSSQVELQANSSHHNPMGIVHGGIYCDLADAAMGIALASLVQPGEVFSTIDLNIYFYTPVREATLRASARVVRRGRNIAFLECNVTDQEGQLIARATSTCQIVTA